MLIYYIYKLNLFNYYTLLISIIKNIVINVKKFLQYR